MPKPITFPAHVERSKLRIAPPGANGCDVVLPTGEEIAGSFTPRMVFFTHDGVLYGAQLAACKLSERRCELVVDLRDQDKLAAFEASLEGYERAIDETDDPAELDRLSDKIEEEADACGYNNHRRLAALHTWVEQRLGVS